MTSTLMHITFYTLAFCLIASLAYGTTVYETTIHETSANKAEPAAFTAIMQPKVYHADINLADYYVSEKLDGVRARWNGKQLTSRQGIIFAAPPWFTQGFPDQIMDGELWIDRGKYQQLVSIVLRKAPHPAWQKVKFMIFDLPQANTPFAQRWQAMQTLKETQNNPYLHVIPQRRFTDQKSFMQHFNAIIDQQGEGLILHKANAQYQDGRSKDLLKLKPYADMEAKVIGYKPGKGKFTGLVGSLKVRLETGIEFHIGSGLTMAERKQPPAIGSYISFRHQGFTDKGIPRFAVFLRLRTHSAQK